MTAVVTSAPGKIVLCGEYAVLDGAPAICMAIDKRAWAKVERADADIQSVATAGYIDGAWKFRVGDSGEFEWLDSEPPVGGLELLREALRTIDTNDAFDVRMDTSEFVDPVSQLKLGLGSSAALTAALVTALLTMTDRAGDTVMEAARAHRRLQHGRGSGVDIAASLNGGVIEYRMQDSGTWRSVPWPDGLEYGVYWSGQPASTSARLSKFDKARGRGGSGESMVRLHNAAESTAKIWSTGNTADLLAEFHRYIDALMQFGVDHDLGIFDAGHGELAEAAANRDLAYKPCGAGGGDTGIILATDKQAVIDFTALAGEAGFQLLDVSLETHGVRLES